MFSICKPVMSRLYILLLLNPTLSTWWCSSEKNCPSFKIPYMLSTHIRQTPYIPCYFFFCLPELSAGPRLDDVLPRRTVMIWILKGSETLSSRVSKPWLDVLRRWTQPMPSKKLLEVSRTRQCIFPRWKPHLYLTLCLPWKKTFLFSASWFRFQDSLYSAISTLKPHANPTQFNS